MISLLLAASVACASPGSAELVGLWETHEKSIGGIGGALELRADGTAIHAITVLVEFRYSFDGERLTLRGEDAPADEPSSVQQVRIDGDTMVVTLDGGAEVRKSRVGEAARGAAPIAGVWSYLSPQLGRTVFERFQESGDLQFRLPLGTSHGCYSVAGDKLVIALEQKRPKRHRFALRGDELELIDSGSKSPERLDRVEGGAWYDVTTGATAPERGLR